MRGLTYSPSERDIEVALSAQIYRLLDDDAGGCMSTRTPAGDKETLVLLNNVPCALPAHPNITRIITPKNSAMGSLIVSLVGHRSSVT